jgi:hypothetical protein
MHCRLTRFSILIATIAGVLIPWSSASAIDYFTVPVGGTNGNPNIRSLMSGSAQFTDIPGLITVGILSSNGTKASTLQDDTILHGNYLLSPMQPLTIKTKMGVVDLKGKSVALLFVTDHSVSLYALDETRSDGVMITVDKSVIQLKPGNHITVAGQETDRFAKVNFGRFISHRKLQTESAGQLKLFKSEFNIFTALNAIESLHKAAEATKGPEKKAVDHLLKTAAIQDQLALGYGRLIQTGGPITFQFVTD